jgi:hypothetical protein
MKKVLLNFAFLALVIASAVGLFVLKHQVMAREKELRAIHVQIWNDKREIHILKADWALLNNPERLRELIRKQSDFKSLRSQAQAHLEQIPYRQTDGGRGDKK